jgi:Mrp family chromosome partitioning ATPase
MLRSGTPLIVALPRGAPRGLSHEDAHELVTLLSADAELLIIHAPSPSYSRSTLAWARAANATVLVIWAGHTKRAIVAAALEGLEPAGSKLIGTVLKTARPTRFVRD